MDNNTSKIVDVYRGLLAQYVIISHIIPTLFPSAMGVPGTLAVWGFFVTSGFLNACSLQRNPAVLPYYWRRITRLYPLLLLSFSVVAILQSSVQINDLYTLLPAVIWIKDVMPYNSVLWTIIVELQLYILSPFIAYILTQLAVNRHTLVLALLFFPIISLSLSVVVSKLYSGSVDLDDRTFLSAVPLYCFGMMLAYCQKSATEFLKNKYIAWALAFVIFIIFIGVLVGRNFGEQNWDHLFVEGRYIPFVLTALLLSGAFRLRHLTSRGIYLKLGRLTYEIYLFHGLFVYILYKFVELPTALQVVGFFWIFPIMAAYFYDWMRSKGTSYFIRLVKQSF